MLRKCTAKADNKHTTTNAAQHVAFHLVETCSSMQQYFEHLCLQLLCQRPVIVDVQYGSWRISLCDVALNVSEWLHERMLPELFLAGITDEWGSRETAVEYVLLFSGWHIDLCMIYLPV